MEAYRADPRSRLVIWSSCCARVRRDCVVLICRPPGIALGKEREEKGRRDEKGYDREESERGETESQGGSGEGGRRGAVYY